MAKTISSKATAFSSTGVLSAGLKLVKKVGTFSEAVNGASAFVNGKEFQITGYDFDVPDNILVRNFKEALADDCLEATIRDSYTNAINAGKSEIEAVREALTNAPAPVDLNVNLSLVLTTTLGNKGKIWVHSFYGKVRTDFRGQVVERDGTFDKYMIDKVKSMGDTDAEKVAEAIVTEFKNKTLKVRRKYFKSRSETNDGSVRLNDVSIPCLDII